jgi:probable phosphoglycerate mutase
MLNVLLVRHGRTLLNAEGRLRGLADPELDETGVEQAGVTAKALASHHLTRVVSSPLHRAATTAEIIAAASGLVNEVDAAFNDRDYGPWTGHIKDEVIAEWGSVDAAPGVEDQTIVFERAMARLDEFAARGESGVLAVVSHDAVIRPILESIQPDVVAEVENGSWAEISHDGERWTLISVDNVP